MALFPSLAACRVKDPGLRIFSQGLVFQSPWFEVLNVPAETFFWQRLPWVDLGAISAAQKSKAVAPLRQAPLRRIQSSGRRVPLPSPALDGPSAGRQVQAPLRRIQSCGREVPLPSP